MKKLVLCLFSIFLLCRVYGQVNFAIKSGANISTTKGLITLPKNRLGWYAGVVGNIQLREKSSIEPEILYSSKGYRYIDLSDGKTVAMRLNYLSVPILFKYRIDKKTKVLGGGEFSYLIKAVNQFNNTSDDATVSFPRRYDLGLAIGLQYDIIKPIFLEARYIYGLNGFYQVDAVGLRRSESWAANRSFQLGILYWLRQ